MSLGVYDYLAWQPAELERAAVWFANNARLLDRVAGTVRDGAERGTEAQNGEFIDSVRDDADATARRIDGLSDMLLEAEEVLRSAGATLVSAVDTLRGYVEEARADGFDVRQDGGVTDTAQTQTSEVERQSRGDRAGELRDRIVDVLRLIRDTDDSVNRAMHEIVGRDVRDRTEAGNNDPTATYAAAAIDFKTGLVELNMEKMIAAGGLPQLDGKWWNSARGFGLFGNLVGFVGNVAAAPEDEPWYETLVAEGAGVVGGTIGSAAGPFVLNVLSGGKLGPEGRLLSALAGGAGGSVLVSSEVREAFDRAN